jgi:hypothetical protein
MVRSWTETPVIEGKPVQMLVARNLAQTLWEPMLPPEYQQLPAALAAADALLDDPVFSRPTVSISVSGSGGRRS